MAVIKYMINKIIMVFTTIKPLGATVIALLSFFAPISSMVYGMIALVIIDLITGIIAYFKKNKLRFKFYKSESWRHITSNGLGNTIQKSLIYLLLIISGFIIDSVIIPNTTLLITKVMAGASSLREIKSIIENSEIILGAGIITYIKLVAKHGFQGAFKQMLEDKDE